MKRLSEKIGKTRVIFLSYVILFANFGFFAKVNAFENSLQGYSRKLLAKNLKFMLKELEKPFSAENILILSSCRVVSAFDS